MKDRQEGLCCSNSMDYHLVNYHNNIQVTAALKAKNILCFYLLTYLLFFFFFLSEKLQQQRSAELSVVVDLGVLQFFFIFIFIYFPPLETHPNHSDLFTDLCNPILWPCNQTVMLVFSSSDRGRALDTAACFM